MTRRAVGLDIGGTHIRGVRADEAGRVEARRHAPCPRAPESVLALCAAMAAELGLSDVEAVGVGVPGRVDAGARTVLSGGYVDLSGLPFADRLGEATGRPVRVENDAAMALWAEARGLRAAAMLTLGTGVGGAAIEDGKIVRGRRAAGQFGHLVVDPAGPPCLCGRRGCLETMAAGPALARHVADAGLPRGTTAEALLADPSPEATAALSAWAAPLRAAVESLAAAFDPEVIVLGGGLGAAAVEALARHPPASSWYDVPVRAARLGDGAGAVGAALAALDLASGPRRAILVNGVPASGKSGVARVLADALGWPLLSLDTIKAPFLAALPPGDRDFNRTLGRAAMAAMGRLAAEGPGGGMVLDAWFGFRPEPEVRAALGDLGDVREVWCEAPPAEIGRRYAARVPSRGAGHPGLDYVPELEALAARATPLGWGDVLRVDTTRPLDVARLLGWARRAAAEQIR